MAIILPMEQAFKSILLLEIFAKLGKCLRSVEWRRLKMGRSGRVLIVIGNRLLRRPVSVVTVEDTRVSGCLNRRLT